MNAQEMYTELTEHKSCEGLEVWLKEKLLPMMRNSSNLSVVINTRDVRWASGPFIRDMEHLGYWMEHKCDDRPCAIPYYRISLKFNKHSL